MQKKSSNFGLDSAIIPYRHAVRQPEFHGLLQNGVELVKHVLEQDWCDPSETQLFVSGIHWRHVRMLIDRIVELIPEIQDDDHPLEARCQNCNSAVGKVIYIYEGKLAEVLFDNSVDSCRPGATQFFILRRKNTRMQWHVVENAVQHLRDNVRSPFEQNLWND